MGVIRATSARKRLKAAAPVAPVVPSKPVGIPGGGNYSGRIQTIEPNQLLREQNAFGRAGTQSIGEWADLALTNPFVTAGLDFICAPIADARIDIEVDDEDESSTQVADFLRWALEKRFRLSAHNDTAARGFLVSGFALFEPRAELVPCPVLGRDVFALAALEQRLPNSLSPNAWREDAEGRLVEIEQQGPRGGESRWTTLRLPAKDTLLYSWKRLGNNWAGESQLRSVWYPAARIMPLLLKLVGVTSQREGAGLPVAFATENNKADITPDQRAELMTFFANVSFHESSGIVLPQGFDVKWIHSPGANKGHILDIWKALGLVVLQQLGAQQLVLGTDNTGSRSVGEVHDARAMAFVRKVLSFQEGILNGDGGESHTGLVSRLLKWNGLLSGAPPRVKLTPKRPEMALTELAAALVSLKGAGILTVTHDVENVVRERAGLPPISEEERDEAKEKAAALAPQLQPGFPPKQEDKPEAKARASAQRQAWKPWRKLTASEEKMNLPALDAYFTAQRDVFEVKAKALTLAMLAKATPAIHAMMSDGKVLPVEIAAIPLDSARLKGFLGEFVQAQREAGAKSVHAELGRTLRAAAEDEQDDKDKAEIAIEEADEVTAAQTDALERKVLARLRGELEREAVDALRTGDDAAGVVERVISRQLDSGAFRGDAGYVTTKAFNVGRSEAASILGGVTSVVYSAILDSQTCEACMADDGKTAAFNSAEHDALLPPNRDCAGGDNCRCLLTYETGLEGGDE